MKQIIINILCNGFSNTKRPLEEICDYVFILKYIFKKSEWGGICCNENAFWDSNNNKNRIELMQDIMDVKRRSVKDFSYFHILNRFANGDKYGIETE